MCAAFFRVLDGIDQEIGYHLLDAHFVTEQGGGEIGVGFHLEGEAFVFRPLPYHVRQVAQKGAQLVLCGDDLHLARFYLGEIQNVVDEFQQGLGCLLEILGVFQDGGIL